MDYKNVLPLQGVKKGALPLHTAEVLPYRPALPFRIS